MKHLKPLTKPHAVPLLQNVRGFSFSLVADELLLDSAPIVSEGMREDDIEGDSVYCGSTLVTIDLDRRDLDLGPADEKLELLVDMAKTSVLFRLRLLRLARLEAERRSAPYLLRGMSAETEFRIEGRKFLVDINVECALAEPAAGEENPAEGEV